MTLRYYSQGFHIGKTALATASALLLTHLVASATVLSLGVDLGASGRTQDWAVFSLGGGVTVENPGNEGNEGNEGKEGQEDEEEGKHHDKKGHKGGSHGEIEEPLKKKFQKHGEQKDATKLSGHSVVGGNVGVAGLGDITLRGHAEIDGNLSFHTGGTLMQSGHAQILGGTFHNLKTDSILDQGVHDAIAASNADYALSASVGYPCTINANKSLTLSGTGNVVLKLTDFTLSGNARLTLQGTATSAFIINVSNKFSLSGGASVSLSGGLTWNNVLFNVRGGGIASLSGSSQLNGIILAPNRTVELGGHAQVLGEIIANKVVLSGGSSVQRPPIVSP